MKKVLSTVAALGLVAGLASTAAAVEFKMSGKYMVEGAYLSSVAPATAATPATTTNGGVDPTVLANEDAVSDAYFMHTFEIKPTMKVNDKVSMASVIRLADRSFWGNQEDTVGNKMSENGMSNVYVHQLYMDYASPIGNMRFGRTPAGTYGTNFQDFDQRGDRVMLYPSFLADGPWSTLFYIQKTTNSNTANDTLASATGMASDSDNTSYVARVYYKTDALDSGLHYQFTNNQTDMTLQPDGTWTNNAALSDVKQTVTAYAKYKMDNYFVNGELTHNFGEKDYQLASSVDRDYDSWSGMLQVGGKFDALTPSLMYFYAQGQDKNETANNGDIENALGSTGTGDLFEPLYILTGRHTGMLNNDIFNGQTSTMSTAGVHAIVAAADYAVSNQLSLHGAIGWAKADEAETATRPLRDDAYGWEYNVGAAYKLLDNLTYEAHFGYLDTGDFFNSADTGVDNAKNIYILTHSLTMTF